MKKYTTLQNKMASVIMIIAASLFYFIGCNTEDIDPNVPHIEVDQTSVDMSGSGGEVVLNITSNRSWATSVVPNSEDWLITDKSSGKNDGQIVLTIAPNTGTEREATLRIATSSIYIDVRVKQTGDISTTVLYADDFGSGLTASPWPDVAAYTGYNITGAGANNVTYSAEGGTASVRGNSPSTGYTGASGNHNIMMAAGGASFRINNIDPLGNTTFMFSFGSNETSAILQLYYSVDGTTWTNVPYTKTTEAWGLVEGVIFDIPSGSTQLFLKFTAAATTYGTRVDDVKLIGYVSAPSDLSISPSSLVFAAAGETKSFNITSTKAWTVVSSETWCTVNTASGSNNLSIDVTADANNTGAQRTATITVETTDHSTTRTLTITQLENAGDVIWLEDVGTTTVASPYPLVADYVGWKKGGSGGSAVVYSGTNTSVRYTVSSAGEYAGASGPNSVFFGAATSSFEATGITLSGVSTATLTFGISKVANVGSVNVWDAINSGDINLYYSINGGAYTLATWSHATPGATWALATAIIPTTGATTLNLKWECTVASAVRLDDMKLVGGGSGSTEYLNLSTNSLNFVATGEQKTFDITSNVASWMVDIPVADQSWCSVNTTSGSNSATITVTTTANIGAARNTTITVSGTGVANKTVAITQAEYEVIVPSDLTKVEWDFTLSTPITGLTNIPSSDPSTSKLTTTANSGIFNVISGSPNYIVAPGNFFLNTAWVMEIPVTGFTGGDVDVSFAAQSSNTGPRDFALEWSADGTSWSTATAAQEYALTASSQTKTITITTSGITTKLYIRLRVRSNISVRAGTGTYPADEAIAAAGTSRLTGNVTVEKASASTPTLTVTPTSLSFVAAGEQKTFDITSNVAWNIGIPVADQSWCSVNTANGNTDATITVTATANTGAARNTTITISGTGVTDKTVTISQAASSEIVYLNQDFLLCTGGTDPFSTTGESSTDLFDALFAPTTNGVARGLTDWTGSKVYDAKGAIKLGTASAIGWIQTPALTTITGTVNLTVTFKAGKRTTDTDKINVEVIGAGNISGNSSIEITSLSNSVMEEKTVTVTGATAATQIKISAVQASNNRYYLDDIKIVKAN